MALTQNPDGDNWPVLVQSLSIVDGVFAQQVIVALATVDKHPDKPEPFRQVIIRGLKMNTAGGKNAVKLLEKWTGKQQGESSASLQDTLAAWQKWFTETYPDQPEPKLPVESAENKWTYDELIAYLNSADGSHGSVEAGGNVFTKAQCVNCHRYGDKGDSVGPDLTTVRNRFQKKEILESILYPSLVISDQYISKTITTTDGRNITGLVAPQSDGSVVVMQSNGQKITIAKDLIDQTLPSKISAMPEGLLNTLSLEDIANLFAYLNQPPQSASITSRPVMDSSGSSKQ
jgi:putative heme-binding domain-containing protein